MRKLECKDGKGKRRSIANSVSGHNEPCSWSVLCKEDKDQLDRIEEKLDKISEKLQNESA